MLQRFCLCCVNIIKGDCTIHSCTQNPHNFTFLKLTLDDNKTKGDYQNIPQESDANYPSPLRSSRGPVYSQAGKSATRGSRLLRNIHKKHNVNRRWRTLDKMAQALVASRCMEVTRLAELEHRPCFLYVLRISF